MSIKYDSGTEIELQALEDSLSKKMSTIGDWRVFFSEEIEFPYDANMSIKHNLVFEKEGNPTAHILK